MAGLGKRTVLKSLACEYRGKRSENARGATRTHFPGRNSRLECHSLAYDIDGFIGGDILLDYPLPGRFVLFHKPLPFLSDPPFINDGVHDWNHDQGEESSKAQADVLLFYYLHPGTS